MTNEQIKQRGRAVAMAARDAEWRRLNTLADALYAAGEFAECEGVLSEMADLVDRNTTAELEKVPVQYRDAVAVAVTEYFGRLCGLI